MGSPDPVRGPGGVVARLTAAPAPGMIPRTMAQAIRHDTRADPLEDVRRVLRAERKALDRLLDTIDDRVVTAVDAIVDCRGRVVVCGMGKCAHVGRKIAATLSSTGTPALFLHPAEALHGDIGVVQSEDLAIVLSNSGETGEITSVAPLLRERADRMIAFCGRPNSSLARMSDICLDTSVNEEGDALGLAPMASTTAMIALGDALAAAAARKKGFTESDYARLHPGGALGYRLLCRVADLMHTGDDLPRLPEHVCLREAILAMTAKRLGTVFFVDDTDRVTGVLTDGDIRRMLQHDPQPLEHPVREAMSPTPRATTKDTPAIDALRLMEQRNPVTCLAVVDANNRLIGALHIHDLIRAGIA